MHDHWGLYLGEGIVRDHLSVHCRHRRHCLFGMAVPHRGIVGLVSTFRGRQAPGFAKEGAKYNVRANVVCPAFVRTPLVDKQIPEQVKELGISEDDVIKKVVLKDTVDGEFTTTKDVAEAVLFFAGAETNALTGQSLIVSHGWFME
jgi:hypothetical protein